MPETNETMEWLYSDNWFLAVGIWNFPRGVCRLTNKKVGHSPQYAIFWENHDKQPWIWYDMIWSHFTKTMINNHDPLETPETAACRSQSRGRATYGASAWCTAPQRPRAPVLRGAVAGASEMSHQVEAGYVSCFLLMRTWKKTRVTFVFITKQVMLLDVYMDWYTERYPLNPINGVFSWLPGSLVIACIAHLLVFQFVQWKFLFLAAGCWGLSIPMGPMTLPLENDPSKRFFSTLIIITE